MASTLTPEAAQAGGTAAQAGVATEDARLVDARLADAAKKDGRAFAELYRRYFRQVYSYHLMHTGSIEDAQDLTSQTFMAALEGIQQYGGRGSFAAWLMGIAHNKMAMYFRGRKPEMGLDLLESRAAPAASTEDLASQHSLLRQVKAALHALSPDRAEAFVLRTFGGLSAAETAQVLGKSEAAVKMLVFRALRDVRQKLEGTREEEKA